MATKTKKHQPILLEFMLVLSIITIIIYCNGKQLKTSTLSSIIFKNTHPRNFTFANSMNVTTSKRNNRNILNDRAKPCLLTLLIILSGDIEINPGPRNASIFPCGTCDIPVTWSQEGVCCNNCSVWYHKSCEELSKSMSYLNRSSVVWHCCKCDSLNVDSFVYNSYELTTSNFFTPLSGLDSTLESVTSSCFSPIHTSSPRPTSSKHSTSSKSNNKTPSRLKSSSEKPTKAANLRLLTVNCCGIRSNKAELHSALEYLQPDIVCGTESWLKGVKPGKDPEKNAIKNSEVFPEKLQVHRNDRSNGIGGGVFIGIKDNLISDAQPDLTTDCEIIWSKVRMNNKKDVYICSFYMPHRHMDCITKLHDSLLKLQESATEKHIIIAGDFNCPHIDWDSLSVEKGAPEREVQQALIDLATEHGLIQVHRQATRDSNLLDLVFTTNPSLVKSSTSVPGISDHSMIVTDIDIIPHYIKQKPRKYYLFSRANWDSISADMTKLSSEIYNHQEQNIEEMWNFFKENIAKSVDRNVPSKMSKKRKSLPWFNHDLKRRIKRKSRLYNNAKKTGNWTQFKTFQRECKRAFKKAEIQHVNNTIQKGLEENNSKPFWRYVKSRRQDRIGVAPLKKAGQLFNNSKDKAQILVDQFKSVFTKHSISKPDTSKRAKTSIPTLKITTEGVQKLLSNINTEKARGPDDIPNIILKTCAKEIAPALRYIFQSSVNQGKLPSDWRTANVTPAFKKGDCHLPENYRPVSLTSVPCKLLEHIICKHILDHLERNKILTSLNHGFRSGFSCESQLVTTVHNLLQQHDEGAQIDMVILDFSKAFDTVPHNSLLHKMELYGIKGKINSWLRDFLTNRTMRVVVDGEASEPVSVDSGVPQGTVLGPLAFLCHINDLPDCVESSVRLFADDCLLYRKVKNIRDHIQLQKDLKALEKWASTWGMRFNAKKCYIMSINSKSSHFYQLDNTILKQVEENPYLGVTIADNLKFGKHISKITSKANSTLGFLRRNLKHCPLPCRKTAYLSLIRSTLEYSSIVWDPFLQKDIDALERVQRRSARFISGDYTSREAGCITKMLKDLDLPPLQDRRKDARLTFFYKVAEGLVPAMPCNDYLTPIRGKRLIRPKQFSDCLSQNIIERQGSNHYRCFKPINCLHDQYKNSFFPRTIIDWNNLDSAIVCAETVRGFREALHKRD